MSGKKSRDKGGRGERLACKLLKPIFPDVTRELNDPVDVRKIDLRDTGKLSIQVKHYQNHVPLSIIDTIIPLEGHYAALISLPTGRDKKTGKKLKRTITLYLDDFIAIAGDIGKLYE